MVAQSTVYNNKADMVNGNGQGQLTIRNVAIPYVDEPTTDIILSR